jgi:hypothetical protein
VPFYNKEQHDALCGFIGRKPLKWRLGAPAGGSYYPHDALLHGRWCVERQDRSWNAYLNGVFLFQVDRLREAKTRAERARKNKLLFLLDTAVRDKQEVAIHYLTQATKTR